MAALRKGAIAYSSTVFYDKIHIFNVVKVPFNFKNRSSQLVKTPASVVRALTIIFSK